MTAEPQPLLNMEPAWRAVESIPDPILGRLVDRALSLAIRRQLHLTDMSEDEWREQLPDAPFDLLFYERVMEALFTGEGVKRMLDGDLNHGSMFE